MCTVTIIPFEDGVRLVCNRDEQRTRPAALPPRVVEAAGRLAVMPVDPQGGGTWIAVNDAGIAFALLNANRRPSTPTIRNDRVSRGQIIPTLLGCDTIDEAIERARRVRVGRFEPFQLIVATVPGCVHLVNDGAVLEMAGGSLACRPSMFTSSGLGDELVEAPRRELFDRMLIDESADAARQDAFHRHHWPDRPQLSVNMYRVDARTVSRTVVELGPRQAVMSYDAFGDAAPAAAPVRLDLRLDRKHLQVAGSPS